MGRTQFEDLEVYKLAERIADAVWEIVSGWDDFPRRTVGSQLVRAADSIGANIAEGNGRGSYKDNKRFVRIARGSLNETKHWLRRAWRRRLLAQEQVDALKPLMDELAPRLNAYLRSIGRKQTAHPPRTTMLATTDTGRPTSDRPLMSDEVEQRWADAWNDVYDLVDERRTTPCILPDYSRVGFDECLGWLQSSVYQGFHVTVSEGWYEGRRAVFVNRDASVDPSDQPQVVSPPTPGGDANACDN